MVARRAGKLARAVYPARHMEGGDHKSGRATRVPGRPPFGLGPIARVSTVRVAADGARPDESSSIGIAVGPAFGMPMAQRGYPERPGAGPDPARTRAFGLPNLRRNVCPHFYVTGARGALPIHAPHLLKGLVRQDSAVSRCQLRGGVHLEQSYVNDVCLSPRFNQCVFYEEDLSQR
jgi:hypothetical protein